MTNGTIYLAECDAADGLHSDTFVLSTHTTQEGALAAATAHVAEVGLDNPEEYTKVREMELVDDEADAEASV